MVKRKPFTALPYVLAVVAPTFATVISFGVERLFPKGSISLVYLLAVLLVAARSSYKPAVLCAVLSFIAYNLFFTEPRLSLMMSHREDVYTVFFFIVIALVAGHQAARLRTQIVSLQTQERFLNLQMQFGLSLQKALDVLEVIQILQSTISSAFGDAVKARRLPVSDARPDAGIRRLSDSRCQLVFSSNSDQLDIEVEVERVPEQWYAMVETLYQHASMAIARTRMAEQVRSESLRAEQEHLRSALLSSVSHDLKTPLAGMIGAASSLRDLADDLSESDKSDLLDSILEEARRLEGYIQNLLDMTRLGQGELTLDREWIGMDEIIHVVLKRVQPLKGERRIDVQVAKDAPAIYVHPALIEQALFNVLENAIKFSPPASTINIAVRRAGEYLQTDVMDEGPGIPEEQRNKVFDMFHSVSRGDYHQAGTGLGLAICQGMLGAHGGRAEVLDAQAASGMPHGACIRLYLPLRYGYEAKPEVAP